MTTCGSLTLVRGAEGPAGAKALRLDCVVWWRGPQRARHAWEGQGQGQPASAPLRREGREWVFTCALSLPSLPQGSLP